MFMKPKIYDLLEQCVLDGVAYGHTRAYKYNDAPTEATINDAIVNAVMGQVNQWFTFAQEER